MLLMYVQSKPFIFRLAKLAAADPLAKVASFANLPIRFSAFCSLRWCIEALSMLAISFNIANTVAINCAFALDCKLLIGN